MKIRKTKKMVTTGMLCALAYVAVTAGRIPVVLFLKYDPKDVIIVIGGLLFGPFTSLTVAGVVCVVEMLTVSSTGIFGCMMNFLSSCSFACTAAYIYKKHHRLSGVVLGLCGGWGCQTAAMMFWNYLIAPLYMGYPREAVAALLLPVFLPFNLMKGGLNTAITLLLYKPAATVLRRTGLLEEGGNSRK